MAANESVGNSGFGGALEGALVVDVGGFVIVEAAIEALLELLGFSGLHCEVVADFSASHGRIAASHASSETGLVVFCFF